MKPAALVLACLSACYAVPASAASHKLRRLQNVLRTRGSSCTPPYRECSPEEMNQCSLSAPLTCLTGGCYPKNAAVPSSCTSCCMLVSKCEDPAPSCQKKSSCPASSPFSCLNKDGAPEGCYASQSDVNKNCPYGCCQVVNECTSGYASSPTCAPDEKRCTGQAPYLCPSEDGQKAECYTNEKDFLLNCENAGCCAISPPAQSCTDTCTDAEGVPTFIGNCSLEVPYACYEGAAKNQCNENSTFFTDPAHSCSKCCKEPDASQMPQVTVMIKPPADEDAIVYCTANNIKNTWGKVKSLGSSSTPILDTPISCENDVNHPENCKDDGNKKTLVFYVNASTNPDSSGFLLDKGAVLMSVACWSVSMKSFLAGKHATPPDYKMSNAVPPKNSLLEFSADDNFQLSVDVSGVQGITHAIGLSWGPETGGNVEIDCKELQNPAKDYPSLKLENVDGHGTMGVLADTWQYSDACNCKSYSLDNPECNTDACYAKCPSALADNAVGQHYCRMFYQNVTDYCKWMRGSATCTSYCWALDEKICKDNSCGYGGADQPEEDGSDLIHTCFDGDSTVYDCSSDKKPKSTSTVEYCKPCNDTGMEPEDFRNRYSCGMDQDLANPEGGTWWDDKACVDNVLESKKKPNPTFKRTAGTLTLSFEIYSWLALNA